MDTSLEWREQVVEASRKLNLVSTEDKDALLLALADETEKSIGEILSANALDLEQMERTNPLYDRLLLTEQRLKDIASDMRKVASLPSPLNRLLESRTLPNGLKLEKRSVPFGVIGIIYEARPNVSFDVFSLCFKSGSVCVLKGGTNAHNSNMAIVAMIKRVLEQNGMDPSFVHLLPAGRASTAQLMDAVGYVDLIIPRGGAGLIQYVRDNSRVPVIETGAGVVQTYFDESGDLEKGKAVVFNAKTRRVSVCNALDTLLVSEKRILELAELCEPLASRNVTIEADERAYAALNGVYPANLLQHADENTFGKEFMDYRMGLRIVASIDEAIAHITRYGSKHSECIITEDEAAAEKFLREVDAACVYVNASTAFTDGGQFGMGAEIGISTQKLHARGPMALPELTSYKWLIRGNGQTRS